MKIRQFAWLVVAIFVGAVIASVFLALAATNTVQVTHLEDWNTPITIAELYPVCAGMSPMPTVIILCNKHTCNGTNQGNEVVVGGPNTVMINGKGGNDCCIGAPGTSFTNCEVQN